MKFSKMFVFAIIGLCVIGGIAGLVLHVVSSQNPPLKTAALTIGDTTYHVEVADTSLSRARGLSYRSGLGADSAMLFIFPRAGMEGFWMKDMSFSLDMVWIHGGKIVGLTPDVPPQPNTSLTKLPLYYPPEPADWVLELNAGDIAKHDFKIGDEVKLQVN